MSLYQGEPRELRPLELRALISDPGEWPGENAQALRWLASSLLITQQKTEAGFVAVGKAAQDVQRENEYAHKALNRLGVDSYSTDEATRQKTKLSLEARIALLEIRFATTTKEMAEKNQQLADELRDARSGE